MKQLLCHRKREKREKGVYGVFRRIMAIKKIAIFRYELITGKIQGREEMEAEYEKQVSGGNRC